MILKVKNSVFVFFLITLSGFFVSILSYYVLPGHFYNDTKTIIYDKYNEIGLVGSYPFTIWFYNVTGLRHFHFILIGLIQYIIAMAMVYNLGIPERFDKLTVKNFLVYLGVFMIAIFLSMPSKEFLNYIYIYIIVRLIQQKKRGYKTTVFFVFILLLVFSYFFRPYYLLIAIVGIVFFITSKISFKNKKVATIFYGLAMVIVMSLSYGAVKGKFISQKTREDLNELRISGDTATNSAIVSPISVDTWYGESFGIVYGFFSVNFPLNGLKHLLSPQIIVFVIWQLLLFVILFWRYGKCLRQGVNDNYELWAFYVLFSFFIVQGVFEPDLGSAIRHKIGVFPLIYFVLYYDSFRKKV
ncbi:hypothetical protein [Mariniflexile sp. AS56]|uniref:hypothetical protein n=1 Tax=Mariniflexile sp. AS56 TaxID=3063957 RepID=UPI0026ED30DF|nr:hypothetical protein [Mariniflexile sp. AS56]MDO7172158.1 hypothetical protein [Mariniflexile sp. AS56]